MKILAIAASAILLPMTAGAASRNHDVAAFDMVSGAFAGDLQASTSSGGQLEIAQLKGGKVQTRASSGSGLNVAGSCQALEVETSSGSNVKAAELTCESVTVEASSGSWARVAATQGLTANASSGAKVRVNGAPVVVKVRNSSGGRVYVYKGVE
ncbi:MAG TPA: DUF2807 domain-containing protein [Steroidobacteraceae bacterium]|nr:DUF2807 domain-containing protein [Steroidobacteraceae bacterium]